MIHEEDDDVRESNEYLSFLWISESAGNNVQE
jgi:hypothetical protein